MAKSPAKTAAAPVAAAAPAEPAAPVEPVAPVEAAAPVEPVAQAEPAAPEIKGDGDKPQGQSPTVLVVTSTTGKTRYRAGRPFHKEPTELLIADLTEDEIEALRNDPQLSVQEA